MEQGENLAPFSTFPKARYIYKPLHGLNHRPVPIRSHSTAFSCRRGSGAETRRGCLRRLLTASRFAAPLAPAFTIPEHTLARIMKSSSYEKNAKSLEKDFGHRIQLTTSAINGDTAQDLQFQVFLPDRVMISQSCLCFWRVWRPLW